MQIQINDTTYQTPEAWNQLSLGQQLQAYHILMQDTPKEFIPEETIPLKRILLLSVLCPVLDNDFLKEWEDSLVEKYGEEDGSLQFQSLLASISQTITSFFFEQTETKEDEPIQYQLSLSLTSCPYPYLEVPSGRSVPNRGKAPYYKLHAPADGLSNISIYELAATFTLFENYLNTKDESLINTLLATLYRPLQAQNKRKQSQRIQRRPPPPLPKKRKHRSPKNQILREDTPTTKGITSILVRKLPPPNHPILPQRIPKTNRRPIPKSQPPRSIRLGSSPNATSRRRSTPRHRIPTKPRHRPNLPKLPRRPTPHASRSKLLD